MPRSLFQSRAVCNMARMDIRPRVVSCVLYWSLIASGQAPDQRNAPTLPPATKKNTTSETSVVPDRISRTFPASGISRVILRASEAQAATLEQTEASPPSINISGKCEGGAKGYHSPDPNWRETPAEKWGLDFVAKQFGPTLVISSKNEVRYIHHHYTLEQIHLGLPKGVLLVREPRELTGDGTPNLSSPVPHPLHKGLP